MTYIYDSSYLDKSSRKSSYLRVPPHVQMSHHEQNSPSDSEISECQDQIYNQAYYDDVKYSRESHGYDSYHLMRHIMSHPFLF